ncbi:MAG: FKBP-type peptidyl-prolyl cis-trans isomerase [Tannerellaceae bacterium]|nr:FKBP-type peptidyl-prolyl cis-trans isomerase [Tannerellaceae bacterium]
MKKYLYIFLILLSTTMFMACGNDDDVLEVDEEWKTLNEEAFNKIANDPAYTPLQSLNNNGFIYYKVLQEGTGTQRIYSTSTVEVYFKGELIDGSVFDSSLEENAIPRPISVATLIAGWKTAVQYMVEGDEWEIWIPQQLGYGSAGDSRGAVVIKPYSTLIFTLKVVGVTP